MRLFGYYAFHSLINQIRKLFKTWVLLFILVCAVGGAAIGFGAAYISGLGDDEPADVSEEETAQDEEADLEFSVSLETAIGIDKGELIELIAGLVILAVFVFDILGADKSGSKIFLPADVNLLFPSPMKPQSVLLFRLMTQIGMAVLASLYVLFQLPNLINSAGLSPWAALAVVGAWCLTIIAGRLFQILLYTLCSSHPGLKSRMRHILYALLGLLAAGFILFQRSSGLGYLAAASSFFNAGITRFIPFWGWIKGFVRFAVEGNTFCTLLCLAAVLAGGAVLVWVIWHIKADFYEDAMAKSEETAEMLERAQRDENGLGFARRKKDRSERLRRDGMIRGAGANVFFHKTLYNRFRFAHLGFLTKTTETYVAAAAVVAAFCRFMLEIKGTIPVALVLSVMAFYRALGNPLEKDTKMAWFILIPESCRKKLMWSLAGGTVCCFLDILPAVIVAELILWENPLVALAWIPFAVSVDFFSTCVGAFIGLSVPTSAGKMIKQFVQIIFLYFGLVPDIAVMGIGIATGHTALAAVVCAAINVGFGLLFFWFTPLFLEPGAGGAASAGRRYSRVGKE